MEQANLPKQEELNALYGSWNPGAYMRGFENQGLSDQFRQQAMEANQQGIQKTQQEYAQNELMNPLRVEQMKGTNVGQANTNIKTGLENERAQANQGALMSEDLRAHALKMTDDEFKKADQHIESLLRSPNPQEQQLGLKLQSTLPAMLAEKRKNDQAMALQKEQSRSHLGGAQIQANAMLQAERERIAAGKYVKVPKNDVQSMYVKFNSMPPATRLGVTWMALQSGTNPFTQQPLTEQEQQQFQAIHDQDQATVDATNQSRAAGSAGIAPAVKPGGGIAIVPKAAVTTAVPPKQPKLPAGVSIVNP